jgi:cytochrome c biogenesis protein
VRAADDGGGTVLTIASLLRGSGESAPRFAALSDDLGAVLAARADETRPRTLADGGSPE